MQNVLLRALWIWTLKSVAYAAFFLVSMLYFFTSVAPMILNAVYDVVLFLLAFLFAEWIFRRVMPNIRQLLVMILATFIWDTVLLYGFALWLLGPYRYSVSFLATLFFFVIHTVAISLAYYSRKRFAAVSGLAEGLEA